MLSVYAKKALACGVLAIIVGASLIALTPVLNELVVGETSASSPRSRVPVSLGNSPQLAASPSQRVSLDPQTGAIRKQPIEDPVPFNFARAAVAPSTSPQWQEEVGAHGGVSLAVPQSASAQHRYHVTGRNRVLQRESQ